MQTYQQDWFELTCFPSQSFCNLPFFFFWYVLILMISLPVQTCINPMLRKIPQTKRASFCSWKEVTEVSLLLFTHVRDEPTPPLSPKCYFWPWNVQLVMSDSNHLERAAGATMQAAFFGNFFLK